MKASIENRMRVFEAKLSESIDAAKRGEFEYSLGILEALSKETDFRFCDLVKNAAKAREQIAKFANNVDSAAVDAMERVQSLMEAKDYDGIIGTLSTIPEKRLRKEAVAALNQARAAVQTRDELLAACDASMKARDWIAVGPMIERLAALAPNRPPFVTTGEKVGAKLLKLASKHRAARQYQKAIQHLDSIPVFAQDNEYHQLRQQVNDVLWFKDQLQREPFDTPALGRIAVALSKLEPDHPKNRKLVQGIANNLKTGKRSPGCLYPVRDQSPESWLGCECNFLAQPSSVPLRDPTLRPWLGRMNVAIGLALQGIGQAKIDHNLIEKKGLFGTLKKRKDTVSWGFDIGTSSIKAVQLTLVDEEIAVTETITYPLEHSAVSLRSDEGISQHVREALETIAETHELGDTPIWANVPSRHLISRFVLLPPVPDKQANELIEREKATRIPVDLDQMMVQHTLEPFVRGSKHGRAATIMAVKRDLIEGSVETFKNVGLNLVGLQSDSVALANLIHHEFREVLSGVGGGTAANEESNASEEVGDLGAVERTTEAVTCTNPTIAMIHCGAASTIALLVSKNAHWFWNIEVGGEDLIGLLAKETQMTRSQAQALLANPHEIPSPSSNFSVIESRLDEWRARFSKVISDHIDADPRFDLVACYASGGTCYAHQWMRRVLLKDHS